MDFVPNNQFNGFSNPAIQSVIPVQNGFGGFGYNQPNPSSFGNQQPQRNVPSVLPGKIVESYEVFKSMDIPIDGNVYYFPKADRTEMYTKRWLQNGTTEQLVYKLVSEEKESEQNKPNPIDEIMQKLNAIDERIDGISKSIVKPNNNNNNNRKKEVQE